MLDAIAENAELEIPHQLVHARAHEMLEETMTALGRQGISKEAYLQITGQDEESLAHEAEPEAERALRREAVVAAVVEAEGIEPTDQEVLAELGDGCGAGQDDAGEATRAAARERPPSARQGRPCASPGAQAPGRVRPRPIAGAGASRLVADVAE